MGSGLQVPATGGGARPFSEAGRNRCSLGNKVFEIEGAAVVDIKSQGSPFERLPHQLAGWLAVRIHFGMYCHPVVST